MRVSLVRVAGLTSILVLGRGSLLAAAPEPCSLLTAAQVSTALGATAGEGKAVTPKVCQWAAPGKNGSSQKVGLTISDAHPFAMAKMPLNDSRITKTAVSGVGDEAVYGTTAGQAASITVKKGDSYFSVSLMGVPMSNAQAVATQLAKDVLARL